MLEEKRRQEILMAEEAIRHLGKEMARASGMADQAEAASEKLEKANAAVNSAVKDLQKMVETQRNISNESQEFLRQAKVSLNIAQKTLSDAEEHINKVEANIFGAIKEIREASKTIQIIFSEQGKQANLRYNALMQISQDNSNKLHDIAQSIRDSNNKLSSSLSNGFSEVGKQANIRQTASMQILQSNTDIMQSAVKTIEDSNNKLSSSLSNGFSEVEKQADIRYNASSKTVEDNLKKLNDISETQLPYILSILRFASAAAIIGAAASVIVLVLNLT